MRKKSFRCCRCAHTHTHTHARACTHTHMLQDPVTLKSLEKALADVSKLVVERKKDPEERNEFLFTFSDRPDNFFGATLKERQRVCCSIHNCCVFSHTVEQCRCDEGVSPWAKATERSPCIFHHDVDCCKCDRIAMTVGQDESVFHAYLLGTRTPPPTHPPTHTHLLIYHPHHPLTQETKRGMSRTRLD